MRELKLAICSIARNENDFLLEWVSHHIQIGFHRIHIYDNMSTVEVSDTVGKLGLSDKVTTHLWPERPGQMSAYTDFLDKHSSNYDWVAFIDLDEFIIPQNGIEIASLLAQLNNFSAVAVNWLTFGPSGHKSRPSGLVLRNYQFRLPTLHSMNKHVKSIVRPEEVISVSSTPHIFVTSGEQCSAMGRKIAPAPTQDIDDSAPLLIYHYITRSREDWNAKIARGRATTTNPKRYYKESMFLDIEEQATTRDQGALPFAERLESIWEQSRLGPGITGKATARIGEPVMQINPNLIFDIGMSEGNDSAYYLLKGFEVIGVEADPDAYSSLVRRFASEIAQGYLTIINAAAYSVSGSTVKFWKNNLHQGMSTLQNNEATRFKEHLMEYSVPTISWDTLVALRGTPHYCKLDIEGGEIGFLESVKTGSTIPSYFSVECHSFTPVQRLYDLGYRRFKFVNQTMLGSLASSLPNPSKEGAYVSTPDWTHASGPFGSDLPDRWLEFQEAIIIFDMIMKLKVYLSILGPCWFDCHASIE